MGRGVRGHGGEDAMMCRRARGHGGGDAVMCRGHVVMVVEIS